MDNHKELINRLHLDSRLKLEDIPDLDLYMDQVIQLFENKFSASKRREDEKVLTKTMINNYAKGKLFFPVENKKYSKEHLIMISLIYQMKGALSISDVQLTLERLNQKITGEEFDIKPVYESVLKLSKANAARMNNLMADHLQEVDTEVEQLNDPEKDYLEKLLLIETFTEMSNLYRKSAEKLVDDLMDGKEE
ncbi:DUF1836 domain-containing protein [Virgibacillus xinjiangensis]|uniref:DUF1836 domain-containing protein n=1 Tax=Virgibacillus xinjiangensis TaxID=393090 RepID=A0ABV7CZF1_9BACI